MTRKKTPSVFNGVVILPQWLTVLKIHNLKIRLVIFSLVLVDIFFIKKSYDSITLTLIFAYVVACLYKLNDRVTFFFTLLLLAIMMIAYLAIGPDGLTEKTAVWLFLFIAIGIFEQWRRR